jgi:phosphoglycerate dehydrogenase-like enzyme
MVLTVYYPRDISSIYPREADIKAWQVLLAKLDPSIKIIPGTELPSPADYQILISGRPTREQLEASPNLQALLIPWAGLPTNTRELMVNYPDISVHNLHHNAIPTAETALMLLLTAAKRILPIEQKFRQHDWRPRYGPNPALMLSGKTVLILGYGKIGQHIGKVCRALGMRVLAIRRSAQKLEDDPAQAKVHAPQDLARLLPETNVLMITLPLTEETEGMIGEAELDLLPGQAIVVNVGRGPVVNQKALFQALKCCKLHSAGIDVWYNYPPNVESRAHTPPADYPFHTLKNIVMSPHRGGGSLEVEILRMEKIAAVLNATARDGKMPNQVDIERGY